MRKFKFGFTLIEVSLFLAITGLLFLGVTIGVQNSIYQQRYNDVVQSFTDFLGNIYDETMNVQSLGNGRRDKAIYGKMITFGEKDTKNEQVIYVYDVIGNAIEIENSGGGTTLGLLKQLGADVIYREKVGEEYKAVGIIKTYKPNWGARIQNVSDFNDYKGTILVVRDPKTGTVRTFVHNDVIEVNEKIGMITSEELSREGEPVHILTDLLTTDNFSPLTVDFCVNPDGENENNRRTDVRLLEGGMNSSSVERVPLDGEENKCNK